jgi:hypothetical protein
MCPGDNEMAELNRLLDRVKNRKQRKWLNKNLCEKDLEHTRYHELKHHVAGHGVRDWLLKGARAEDAVTIAAAIARLSDSELNRRFTRMLAAR